MMWVVAYGSAWLTASLFLYGCLRWRWRLRRSSVDGSYVRNSEAIDRRRRSSSGLRPVEPIKKRTTRR